MFLDKINEDEMGKYSKVKDNGLETEEMEMIAKSKQILKFSNKIRMYINNSIIYP